MRQRTVVSLVATVAVLAAAGGLALQYNKVVATTQLPSRASPGIPVVAANVERGDVPIYLSGN